MILIGFSILVKMMIIRRVVVAMLHGFYVHLNRVPLVTERIIRVYSVVNVSLRITRKGATAETRCRTHFCAAGIASPGGPSSSLAQSRSSLLWPWRHRPSGLP